MAGQRKSGRIALAAAKLVSRLCIAFYTGQLPTGNCPVLLQAFACGGVTWANSGMWEFYLGYCQMIALCQLERQLFF
jgi:hypothetical protein